MPRRPKAALMLAAIVGGGSVGVLSRILPLPVLDVRFGSDIPFNADRRTGSRPGGREIVFAFVGSPRCGACNHPDLAPMIREAVGALRTRFSADSIPVITVGISPVWAPAEGVRFLSDIMNFDEITAGRSWLNSELVDLAWDYPSADVATPQVVVYHQTVVAPGDTIRASIEREPPVVRATGVTGIRDWIDAGLPFRWRN